MLVSSSGVLSTCPDIYRKYSRNIPLALFPAGNFPLPAPFFWLCCVPISRRGNWQISGLPVRMQNLSWHRASQTFHTPVRMIGRLSVGRFWFRKSEVRIKLPTFDNLLSMMALLVVDRPLWWPRSKMLLKMHRWETLDAGAPWEEM